MWIPDLFLVLVQLQKQRSIKFKEISILFSRVINYNHNFMPACILQLYLGKLSEQVNEGALAKGISEAGMEGKSGVFS